MSDKKLIKEEIERRIIQSEEFSQRATGANDDFSKTSWEFIAAQYKSLLQFIDSLPDSVSEDRINECPYWDKDYGCETSPMNNCDSCPHAKWVEVKEEKKNYHERYKGIAQTEQFKKSYCEKSLGKEEPASEDLEKAAKEWAENHFQDFIEVEDDPGYWCSRFGFIAGAEWQKHQMKEALQTEYEKGRFDMREEMMKNAVHAWVNTYESVTNPYNNRVSFITILSPSKFKNKETVKVIIVKED